MRTKRVSETLRLALAVCAAVLLIACGGGGGSSSSPPPPPPPPPTISVTVTPTEVTLNVGATQQFSANVTGSSNTSVTWNINGIIGGNSSVGTITSSGVYTAPAAVPSPNPVTVTATSQADPSKSASASVTITSPPPPIAMRGVSVSAGTTASGVDIGVRQVTPTLVLRAVGIGNTAGRVGVVVKRGDSPTLFLVGVGVVAGTVYQVSGGGVQVSIINFTQTTGGMPAVRLSVSISASAALGPRSIIATNSAGEISVFVGGLLITP